MKSIETIIKLNQQKLDEKRREIVELQKQKEQLIDYSKKMEKELADELEFTSREPQMGITFDNYRNKIKERQNNISISLSDIDVQLAKMTEQINSLYTQVKKFDIILQQKIAELNKQENKRENKILDEVTMNQYMQDKKED